MRSFPSPPTPPPFPGPVVAVLEDFEAMAHVSLVIAYPTFEQYATTAFTDDGTVREYVAFLL